MSEKDPSLKTPAKANLGSPQEEAEHSLIERIKALSTEVLDAMGVEVSEDTGSATITYRAGFTGGKLIPYAQTGSVPTSRSAQEKRAKLVVKPDHYVSVNLEDIYHYTKGSESLKEPSNSTSFSLDPEGNLVHITHYANSENPVDDVVADLEWLGVFEGAQPTVSFRPPQQ